MSEGPDRISLENLSFAGRMKLLPDSCAQIIIQHLDLGDFDQLRSSASSMRKFTSLHETFVLRRAVGFLAFAGQSTRLALRELDNPEHWSYLFHVSGWLNFGEVGATLQSLRSTLQELCVSWNRVLNTEVQLEEL